MIDIWEELRAKENHLDSALKSLRANGSAYAQAEKDYKEAVSKEALRLKDEGMAVSLIDKVIYGLPSVSVLRFNRDVARVVYEANKEAINVKKLELRILENQYETEFNNGGKQG